MQICKYYQVPRWCLRVSLWISHRDQWVFGMWWCCTPPLRTAGPPGRSFRKPVLIYRMLVLNLLNQSICSPWSALFAPPLICRSPGWWKLSWGPFAFKAAYLYAKYCCSPGPRASSISHHTGHLHPAICLPQSWPTLPLIFYSKSPGSKSRPEAPLLHLHMCFLFPSYPGISHPNQNQDNPVSLFSLNALCSLERKIVPNAYICNPTLCLSFAYFPCA